MPTSADDSGYPEGLAHSFVSAEFWEEFREPLKNESG
jgi:hypothetical protein